MKLEILIQEFIQVVFRRAFEMIDKELVNEYNEKGYEIDRKKERSIQFSFGPLDFSRCRMRKKGEGSIIAFDEVIGLVIDLIYNKNKESEIEQKNWSVN